MSGFWNFNPIIIKGHTLALNNGAFECFTLLVLQWHLHNNGGLKPLLSFRVKMARNLKDATRAYIKICIVLGCSAK